MAVVVELNGRSGGWSLWWVEPPAGGGSMVCPACGLRVMRRAAGAGSTRRLMAVHPGAPPRPPALSALSRVGVGVGLWMGTLYGNHHHFPHEDDTRTHTRAHKRGSLPQLDCRCSMWCRFCVERVVACTPPGPPTLSSYLSGLPSLSLSLSLAASCSSSPLRPCSAPLII